MKKFWFTFWLAAFQLLAFSGWAQEGYVITEPLLVPVHTARSQLHASAGISDGYTLSASYTLTEHLAVFAVGTAKRGVSEQPTFMGGHMREQTNNGLVGGLGYLFNQTPSGVTIEWFAGGGKFEAAYNRFRYQTTEVGGITKAEYWKLFTQANLIWRKKHAELGPILRVAYNTYNNLSYVEVNDPGYEQNRYENVWNVRVEPAFSFSFLYRKVKLNFQVGLSAPLYQSQEIGYEYDSFNQQERRNDELYLEELFSLYLGRSDAFLFGQIGLQYNFNLGSKAK